MNSMPNSMPVANTTSANGEVLPTAKPTASPSTVKIREHEACRVCGGLLDDVLSLGDIAPSGFGAGNHSPERYPLDLTTCSECGLVQLRHTLDQDTSFRHYWYRSALNQSMVAALRDVVECALRQVTLNRGDVATDIGCNDGTLLSMLPPGTVTVGFEPARNLATEAARRAILFVNDYFSAAKYPPQVKKSKLVTSIAMFYGVDQPAAFVAGVAQILHEDGIWVLQMMDLESMLAQLAFDNICFEHLIYYTLADIRRLVEPFGLEVFHVSHNMTNGGSLRAMICHRGQRVVSPFATVSMLADVRQNLRDFAAAVERIRDVIVKTITDLVSRGQRVYVMGASTKGNTLLQYFGLDSTLIDKAAEVNPDKWGLRTVATNIPIASEAECLADHPDYFLVLPWHFITDFVNRNQEYLNRGGRFIVPLPRPAVIGKDEWTFL